ncbi:helix-turn-helix domain-containing protein [uncultured Psychromonas sp.]|uniref:helix-turn-helix domain-containing protein n=1 Tax=uncultured Psychromonas sp. TaxID=173974 RepID=UPI0026292739|nr:helix-turn-helix domain-containing protein [uncultured Psychromonas sp.]
MTEQTMPITEHDTPTTEHDTSATEHETTLGKVLQEHRLAANFSVDELALKLNLKATVIKDIENNLAQLIEEKVYPLIYLRGYLANYSKVVHLSNLQSFPEYQKLSRPAKSVNTLSNPYILTNNKKSSNKFAWFILLLFIGGIATTIYYWENVTASLFPQAVVDTENIHMRLPEPGENSFIDEDNQLAGSQAIETPLDESQVIDSQEEIVPTETSTEADATL